MHEYYTYILRCADGSYYTGVTNELARRVYEHQEGLIPNCYTLTRRPVELQYVEEWQYVYDAIGREKQIKRWTRAKKEALIKENWDRLQKISKRRGGKPSDLSS